MAATENEIPALGDFPHVQTIPTRWKDNDVYGHVNNVEYYSFFDTVINAWLIREGGLDVAIQITNFVLAPKGLPEPVQAYLNREFAAALADKAVRERLMGFGHTVPEPAENTPAAVRAHIEGFHATYGALVSELGIKAD